MCGEPMARPVLDIPARYLLTLWRAILAALLLSIALLALYFGWKLTVIHRMQGRFDQVQLGSDAEAVRATLGPPDHVWQGDGMFVRPAEALHPDFGSWENDWDQKCVRQYVYAVPTYYLPVVWMVSLDANNRVVGKYRLD